MRLFLGPPCCVVVVVVAFDVAVVVGAEWLLSSLTVAALLVSFDELKVNQRLNPVKERHQGNSMVQLSDMHTTRVTNVFAVECHHRYLWQLVLLVVKRWSHHMKTTRVGHGWNKGFGQMVIMMT